MGYTSSAVKRRYNKKTYKTWSCALRIADFDIIDEIKEGLNMSRPEFLKLLVTNYLKEDVFAANKKENNIEDNDIKEDEE